MRESSKDKIKLAILIIVVLLFLIASGMDPMGLAILMLIGCYVYGAGKFLDCVG